MLACWAGNEHVAPKYRLDVTPAYFGGQSFDFVSSQWKSSYYQSTDDAYAKERIGGTALNAVGLLRNMRWEGGAHPERPKPWEVRERKR